MGPHRAPTPAGASSYVSRGGAKLERALDVFGIQVAARRALDAGASTGGFTDVLLQRGASRVIAVDVAYGALDWTLRNDPRVKAIERMNVRALDLAALGEDPVDIIAADLSFISLRAVREPLLRAAAPGADLVLLVKPQFEAPRALVERGGVVRNPDVWRQTMLTVAGAYREAGCGLLSACASPLVGPAGNREFFLHLRPAAADHGDDVIARAVEEAP